MYKQKKSEGRMCCLLIFIYQYNTTILKHLTCQYFKKAMHYDALYKNNGLLNTTIEFI